MERLLKLLENTDNTNNTVNHVQKNIISSSKPDNHQGTCFWILDTGATNNVTCVKDFFVTFYKIKHVHVELPNDSYVVAHYASTIQILKTLVLFNVLFIPKFSFNLIYVQNLIRDLNCKLIFSREQCQI